VEAGLLLQVPLDGGCKIQIGHVVLPTEIVRAALFDIPAIVCLFQQQSNLRESPS
jgi:hypothetical protein